MKNLPPHSKTRKREKKRRKKPRVIIIESGTTYSERIARRRAKARQQMPERSLDAVLGKGDM